jgi:uncharacterized membrane protein
MLQTVIAIITFLILDAIWLGVLAKNLYLNAFGNILRMSDGAMMPYWPAAVVVYFALLLGLLFFVIPKAQGNILHALIYGAVFGFVTYATYDFTNLCVLADWTLKISIIDTIWGMVLCGLTSMITVWLSGVFSS